MAKQVSRDGTIEVSSNGSSYTAIGNVTSITYDHSVDTHDATDYDSGEFDETQKGHERMTLQVNFNTNESDAGQGMLPAARAATSSPYWFRFRPTVGSGVNDEFIFRGRVTSYKPADGTLRDILKGSFSVSSTGSVTEQTQP